MVGCGADREGRKAWLGGVEVSAAAKKTEHKMGSGVEYSLIRLG